MLQDGSLHRSCHVCTTTERSPGGGGCGFSWHERDDARYGLSRPSGTLQGTVDVVRVNGPRPTIRLPR